MLLQVVYIPISLVKVALIVPSTAIHHMGLRKDGKAARSSKVGVVPRGANDQGSAVEREGGIRCVIEDGQHIIFNGSLAKCIFQQIYLQSAIF